jgi:hypothetical protein
MPRGQRSGPPHIDTFACHPFHRETKASKESIFAKKTCKYKVFFAFGEELFETFITA